MPWHFWPKLRAIEECRELTGIYQSLDSAGVTQIKADESGNKRVKLVPVGPIWYESQSPYTPV